MNGTCIKIKTGRICTLFRCGKFVKRKNVGYRQTGKNSVRYCAFIYNIRKFPHRTYFIANSPNGCNREMLLTPVVLCNPPGSVVQVSD